MNLTLNSAVEPRWSNPERTTIDLKVTFSETLDSVGEIPFTASLADSEEHGRDIFRRAVAGEFGAVGEYEAPVLSQEQLAERALKLRNNLLSEAAMRMAPLQDAVELGEATEQESLLLHSWRNYRMQLNRIEQQDGYPELIKWPASPVDKVEELER